MKTGSLSHELYLWHDTGRTPLGYVPAGLNAVPYHHPESDDWKRRFRSLMEVFGLLERMSVLRQPAQMRRSDA